VSGVRGAVDVVIVGGGAAGAVLAARLAEAGKTVVILEAGPPLALGDLVSSQIWSRRLRWGGPYIETRGANPIAVGFNAGWGSGGAAMHHYGTWPRLKPEDFKVRSLYGRGLDWPIDYDIVRPYYDQIQHEVGISGDAKAEVWRPPGAPYPMPPLTRSKQAEAIARGFAVMGKRVAPAPMAINSVEYAGRPACIYDGWCDAGCPIGALANPQVTYLPRAQAAGAITIANAPVRRLIASSAHRIEAVEYLDPSGAIIRQDARCVVLAASVTGNPSILLNSASELHPKGIGNRTGLVGRYLMTHGLLTVVGLFGEETEPHRGVSGAHLISHDDYAKTTTRGAFGSRQWLIGPAIKPNDLAGLANANPGLYGRALDEFMRRAIRHAATMAGMTEEMPNRENRIELGETTTAWGVRSTKLIHSFSDEAVALWKQHRDDGLALFKAGGATEITSSAMNSAHLMGGTIMGTAPDNSVTDSFGQVHGIDNLWIAGPGLFPTSGAVNPTFTVHALAMRTADRLVGVEAKIHGR
jgi:choline dehydrogenase-like flavoprotein